MHEGRSAATKGGWQVGQQVGQQVPAGPFEQEAQLLDEVEDLTCVVCSEVAGICRRLRCA